VSNHPSRLRLLLPVGRYPAACGRVRSELAQDVPVWTVPASTKADRSSLGSERKFLWGFGKMPRCPPRMSCCGAGRPQRIAGFRPIQEEEAPGQVCCSLPSKPARLRQTRTCSGRVCHFFPAAPGCSQRAHDSGTLGRVFRNGGSGGKPFPRSNPAVRTWRGGACGDRLSAINSERSTHGKWRLTWPKGHIF
jgi:hypothetical protein